MAPEIDWTACWLCRRTKAELDRLFDPIRDPEYQSWDTINDLSLCPVCKNLILVVTSAELADTAELIMEVVEDTVRKLLEERWRRREAFEKMGDHR